MGESELSGGWDNAPDGSFQQQASERLDQDNFAVCHGPDAQPCLITHGHAIAGGDRESVDFDLAAGRHQIHPVPGSNFVVGALPCCKRSRCQPGFSTNRQRLVIAGQATGERDEGAGPLASGELASAPGRRQSGLLRVNPYLENARFHILQVVLAVHDPGACAHHLHIASDGTAAVAEAVFMGDGALADVGDDFHVPVRVRFEPRLRRDAVFVPYAQAAPAHALDVMITSKGKVVARVQPAVLRMAKPGIWT